MKDPIEISRKEYESHHEEKERQISELKQFGSLGQELAKTLGNSKTLEEEMKEKDLGVDDIKGYFLRENTQFRLFNNKQLISLLIRYGEEDFLIDNIINSKIKLNYSEKVYFAKLLAKTRPLSYEETPALLGHLQLSSIENVKIIKELVKQGYFLDIKTISYENVKISRPDLVDLAKFFINQNFGEEVIEHIEIFDSLEPITLEDIIYNVLKEGVLINKLKENKKVMDKVNFDAILHRLSIDGDFAAITVMLAYSDFINCISKVDEETTKGIIKFGATDFVLKNPGKFGLKKE